MTCINECATVNALTDTTVFVNEVSRQIQAESLKMGQRSLLRTIEKAARATLVALPNDEEIDQMNPAGRLITNRIITQLNTAVKATEWSTSQLENFAGEMAWTQRIIDLNVAYLRSRNNSDSSTAVSCRKKYDSCINDYNCDTSGWFCICCAPCSIEYLGCTAGTLANGLFSLSIT